MDRGIPSEEVLAEMRQQQDTFYLVGTSRSKIQQYQRQWLELPWQKVRASVEVKRFAQDDELYALAKSEGRQAKERAIRRKNSEVRHPLGALHPADADRGDVSHHEERARHPPHLSSARASSRGPHPGGILAYGLIVTLKNRLQARAPGLTPKAVLETLAAIQMLDVWLPTTEGRWLVLPRYTQPETEQAILLHKL